MGMAFVVFLYVLDSQGFFAPDGKEFLADQIFYFLRKRF
jgi:hypothetical protein